MNIIYKISNIYNGKFLIGSTIMPENRWMRHKSQARCRRHANRYFQFEWDKYGESAFQFEVLEIIEDESRLLQREQEYLDDFYEHPLCLNLNPYADRPASWKGKKRKPFTIEHRMKIRANLRNRIVTKESNDKRRKAMENRMESFTLISPSGEKVDCFGFRQTAQILQLDYRHLIAVVKRQRKSHKGWKLDVA